jgi:sugar lactone lactonase YvrE
LHVNVWDFDPAIGAISNRRRLRTFTLEEGRPDGAATDAAGYYWSAGITARCLNRLSPEGVIVETIRLPTGAPTMPCFGGPEMRDVFVTSSTLLATPEEKVRCPMTGGVFRVRVDVPGLPIPLFAD